MPPVKRDGTEPQWWLKAEGYVQAYRTYDRARRYQHRIMAARMVGVLELPEDVEVHHLNHRPWDNRMENLCIMTAGAHRALGGALKASEAQRVLVEHMEKWEWEELVKGRVTVPKRLLRTMKWWREENGEEEPCVPF